MQNLDSHGILCGHSQKEFKNENGLPSYNAAGRALEVSPAEYMKERFDEVMAEQQEEAGMGMSM